MDWWEMVYKSFKPSFSLLLFLSFSLCVSEDLSHITSSQTVKSCFVFMEESLYRNLSSAEWWTLWFRIRPTWIWQPSFILGSCELSLCRYSQGANTIFWSLEIQGIHIKHSGKSEKCQFKNVRKFRYSK